MALSQVVLLVVVSVVVLMIGLLFGAAIMLTGFRRSGPLAKVHAELSYILKILGDYPAEIPEAAGDLIEAKIIDSIDILEDTLEKKTPVKKRIATR